MIPATTTTLTMTEIQNSNPTILDAADLPTRLRSSPKTADHGLFTAVPLPADFDSASSDSDDDNLMEEPIDEQEIYGTSDYAAQCQHN